MQQLPRLEVAALDINLSGIYDQATYLLSQEPCRDFFFSIGIGVTTGFDELFFNVPL
jgi:hypothetical protein